MEAIGPPVLYDPHQGSGQGLEQVSLVSLYPTPLQHLLNTRQGSLSQLPGLTVKGTHCVLPQRVNYCLCILGVRQGERLGRWEIWREPLREVFCRQILPIMRSTKSCYVRHFCDDFGRPCISWHAKPRCFASADTCCEN